MRLIENWRGAHKLWSVRFSGIIAAIAGLDWLIPSIADVMPKWLYLVLAAAVAISRIVAQPKATGDGTQ